VLHQDAKRTKVSSFTYKMPSGRHTTLGGMQRDNDGEIIDADAPESGISSAAEKDLLPVDYVVITELSELFDRAVSELCFIVLASVILRKI